MKVINSTYGRMHEAFSTNTDVDVRKSSRPTDYELSFEYTGKGSVTDATAREIYARTAAIVASAAPLCIVFGFRGGGAAHRNVPKNGNGVLGGTLFLRMSPDTGMVQGGDWLCRIVRAMIFVINGRFLVQRKITLCVYDTGESHVLYHYRERTPGHPKLDTEQMVNSDNLSMVWSSVSRNPDMFSGLSAEWYARLFCRMYTFRTSSNRRMTYGVSEPFPVPMLKPYKEHLKISYCVSMPNNEAGMSNVSVFRASEHGTPDPENNYCVCCVSSGEIKDEDNVSSAAKLFVFTGSKPWTVNMRLFRENPTYIFNAETVSYDTHSHDMDMVTGSAVKYIADFTGLLWDDAKKHVIEAVRAACPKNAIYFEFAEFA